MLLAVIINLILFNLIFFFFNDTATTEIYTLSLHDALPIYLEAAISTQGYALSTGALRHFTPVAGPADLEVQAGLHSLVRSEEHTSELQSHLNLVCRLLLEKKKKKHAPGVLHLMRGHPRTIR